MKDYKLSEIKTICETNGTYCEGCFFDNGADCLAILFMKDIVEKQTPPCNWEIDKEPDAQET